MYRNYYEQENIHPKKLYEINDSVEVKVLDIDNEKQNSFRIKQCVDNPWIKLDQKTKSEI